MNGTGMAVAAAALTFGYLNGYNDGSTIVASVIVSRAMSPRRALLFGTAVAATIGRGLARPGSLTPPLLLAAIAWTLTTARLGIPSSSSHARIGGIVGSAAATTGLGSLLPGGLAKVLLALFLAPVVGLAGGYVAIEAVMFLARGATPRAQVVFKRAQIASAVALALSHGANDAQKSMGVIAIALVAAGQLGQFAVPGWVIVSCAAALAAGVATGGWRPIRTVGGRLYRIRPVDAFSAQATAAAVVLCAGLLGGPISSSHVVNSSVLGVGAAERRSKVRWGVITEIAVAWALTIPVTALLGAGLSFPLRALLANG